MNIFHRLLILSGLLLVLVGCGSGTTPTIDLPLAPDKPTFLFFYTDG